MRRASAPFCDFSSLYRSALSLFWISQRSTTRLAAVLEFFFAVPFGLFTLLDFSPLYGFFFPCLMLT